MRGKSWVKGRSETAKRLVESSVTCLGVNSSQSLHHALKRTQRPADAAEPSYCPSGQTLQLGLQPWTWLSYKTSPSHVSVVFEVLQELSPL